MIEEIDGLVPLIDEDCFVHPLASVVGDVVLHGPSIVMPGACLTGDYGRISIARFCTIEENCVPHAGTFEHWERGEKYDMTVEEGTIFGHGAVVHARSIGRNVLVGMNATILEGAVIGEGSIIAAGAVVPEGLNVPPRSFVAGVPGRIKKEVSSDQAHWTQISDEANQRYFAAKIRQLRSRRVIAR